MQSRIFCLAATTLLVCALIGALSSAKPFRDGGGPAVAAGALATLTLVNDGGSTQAANQPTQTFGWIFKDGDICSGGAPQFLDSVAGAQPFSASPANARRYYPSGCLMFASFMIKPTFSVPASGSHALTIKSGGSWPTMGTGTAGAARTLTEVYNQALVVNMPAASSWSGNSVSGTWHSYLLGDVNNYQVVKWLDGDAGTAWRIDTKLAQTFGGTAHPSLRYTHYIIALTNPSGGLGGYRWLGQLREPEYNFSGAPAHAAGFDNITISIGTGVAPKWTWPFSDFAFTTTGCCTQSYNGATTTTNSTNNYYSGGGGSQANGNGNVVPVVFSGASLPGDIGAGQSLFVLAASDNRTLVFCSIGTCDSGNSFWRITSNGSGTVHPILLIQPFIRLSFAGSDGKAQFFQGTGTGITAETKLREQIDRRYWQGVGIFPPWDLTFKGSMQGGAITDTTFRYNWNPYSITYTPEDMSNSGDHPDIGPQPNHAALDFYNQSVLSEKLSRMTSYAAGLMPWDLKDTTTRTILNLVNGTYTGLPASGAWNTVVWTGAGGSKTNVGFSPPVNNYDCSPIGVDAAYDHKPQYNSWTYARFGQLWDLDMLADHALQGLLNDMGQDNQRNPTGAWAGGNVGGVLTSWVRQLREMAPLHRDLELGAVFYPFDPTNPTALSFEGTQTGKYLNDLADQSANYPIDQFDAGATVYGTQNAYVQSRGLWVPFAPSPGISGISPVYQRDGPEWQYAYLVPNMLLAKLRGGNGATKAQRFLTNIMAVRWKYIGEHFGYWPLYHYYERNGKSITNNLDQHFSNQMIGSDGEWAISIIGPWGDFGASISWNMTQFTLVGSPGHGYSFGNNDTLIPYVNVGGPEVHPSAMQVNTPYYVCNKSGANFQVSTRKNATCNNPLTLTDSGANMDFDFLPAHPPSTDWPYTKDYVLILRYASSWSLARGIDSPTGGFAAVTADANYRLANTSGGPYKTYFSTSGTVGMTIDARYAVQ